MRNGRSRKIGHQRHTCRRAETWPPFAVRFLRRIHSLLCKAVEVGRDFVGKWPIKSKPLLFIVCNFHDLGVNIYWEKKRGITFRSFLVLFHANQPLFSVTSITCTFWMTELTTMNGFRQSAFSWYVTVKDHDVYFHPVLPNLFHDIDQNQCNIQHRTVYFFNLVCNIHAQPP